MANTYMIKKTTKKIKLFVEKALSLTDEEILSFQLK